MRHTVALVNVDTIVAYKVHATDTSALVAARCFGTSSTLIVAFVIDVAVSNILAVIIGIINCFKSGVAKALI